MNRWEPPSSSGYDPKLLPELHKQARETRLWWLASTLIALAALALSIYAVAH